MHRHRLFLLAVVGILAVASMGFADTISINISVDGFDAVTATVTNGSGVIKTSSTTTLLGGSDPNGNPLAVTTFTFLSPLDLSGWQGPTALYFGTDETTAEAGLTALFQLLPGGTGFSVRPDHTTGVPLTPNFLTYVAQLGGGSGANIKISDATDVPEPNTLLLLGAGFLSIPWLRARYRKSR